MTALPHGKNVHSESQLEPYDQRNGLHQQLTPFVRLKTHFQQQTRCPARWWVEWRRGKFQFVVQANLSIPPLVRYRYQLKTTLTNENTPSELDCILPRCSALVRCMWLVTCSAICRAAMLLWWTMAPRSGTLTQNSHFSASRSSLAPIRWGIGQFLSWRVCGLFYAFVCRFGSVKERWKERVSSWVWFSGDSGFLETTKPSLFVSGSPNYPISPVCVAVGAKCGRNRLRSRLLNTNPN